MALSENEREQFLAEPHIGALSVADGTERGPLTVPDLVPVLTRWQTMDPHGQGFAKGTTHRVGRAFLVDGRKA